MSIPKFKKKLNKTLTKFKQKTQFIKTKKKKIYIDVIKLKIRHILSTIDYIYNFILQMVAISTSCFFLLCL